MPTTRLSPILLYPLGQEPGGPPPSPPPPPTPTNAYVDEMAARYYVAEDGTTYYVQES